MYKECPKCAQRNPKSSSECSNCYTSLRNIQMTSSNNSELLESYRKNKDSKHFSYHSEETSLNIPKELPQQSIPALIIATILIIRSLYAVVKSNAPFVLIFLLFFTFLIVYIALSYRKYYIELNDENILIRHLFQKEIFLIRDLKEIKGEKDFITIKTLDDSCILRKSILSENSIIKLLLYIKKYNNEISIHGFEGKCNFANNA